MSYKNRIKRHVKAPDAGAGERNAFVRVGDVMASPVYTATRHQTVGQVRELMNDKGVHCTPVVDEEDAAIGIVTSTDLIAGLDDQTLIGKCMTSDPYTVPQYAGVHEAARIMRNHKIHHVVVTHEKRVVGVVSSFDLLRLVEGKRFVAKNAASAKNGKRNKQNAADAS